VNFTHNAIKEGFIAFPMAFCYVGRNIYELAAPGAAPITGEALQDIVEFDVIEKDIRGRRAEERRLVRQQKSRPLAEAFEHWHRAKLAFIIQKGKLADVIRFALSRWESQMRFINDGHLEFDNNTIERSIRPITLNRKNGLFAGPRAVPSTRPLSPP